MGRCKLQEACIDHDVALAKQGLEDILRSITISLDLKVNYPTATHNKFWAERTISFLTSMGS